MYESTMAVKKMCIWVQSLTMRKMRKRGRRRFHSGFQKIEGRALLILMSMRREDTTTVVRPMTIRQRVKTLWMRALRIRRADQMEQ